MTRSRWDVAPGIGRFGGMLSMATSRLAKWQWGIQARARRLVLARVQQAGGTQFVPFDLGVDSPFKGNATVVSIQHPNLRTRGVRRNAP